MLKTTVEKPKKDPLSTPLEATAKQNRSPDPQGNFYLLAREKCCKNNFILPPDAVRS